MTDALKLDARNTLTVEELSAALSRRGSPERRILVRIPTEGVESRIATQPSVDVVSANFGFDWDHGYLFMRPRVALTLAGDGLARERKLSRDRGEALALIWMAATDKRIDAAEKIRSIRRTLKGFGFDFGPEDLGDD